MSSSPEIVKSGLLEKRSQNKGRFTAENYKKRFFVLNKSYFKYYDGTADKLGRKKGEIPLRFVKVVEFVDDYMLENKRNAFQVVYEENTQFFTLYVVASSPDERQSWVDAIRKEAINQDARFLQKYHKGVWTKSLGKFNCCDQVDRGAMGCLVSTPETNPEIGVGGIIPAMMHSQQGRCPPQPVLRPLPPTNNQKQLYIAIYDYDPVEDGDLELCKGDEYEILDNSREHWWRAKNRDGKTGYIPSNYVKKKFDLEIYDWYYKELSRAQAESILKETGHEGCFLVRDSVSTPGLYSLSLFTREAGISVRHYHIKKNRDGYFYIAENHVFESIPDVINYHKYNAGGLVTRLKEPPRRNTKPTTAGFGHSQFEIDPKDLTIGEQLGAGCFGSVHKGTYRGMVVAVKKMKENAMSEESFKEEAKTMTQLSHKNLVQLYGVVTKSRPMCALNNYLQRHRARLTSQVSRLLDFCVQVCQGMAYLESRKFIHRDLAARNCLVGENAVIKVADFGLARYVLDDEYQSSAGTKFPVKWAPPEVLQYTRFSSKSDVWAFGILMWEVFTCGEMPYREKRNVDVVDFVVTQNKRLAKPSNTPMIVYQIMMKCWDKDPEQRPSFVDLTNQMTELNREGDYPHIE
ncbi:hypothetical protein BaRGS_00037988 [Batillaria attramentaria]|uniref:Tyrosine-protein kinase n=1 Tax=Batillaria attramentaria TaxID=370345 RepID=A0ABD0J7E0_9CAEN